MQLDYPRIYILPTGTGVAFAGTLGVLWLTSVNYSSSLGHLLTFLLAGIGFSAMLHAYRNLVGVRVKGEGAAPVHAGEPARFRVRLSEEAGRAREAIALTREGREVTVADVPARDSAWVELAVPARGRGWLGPGRFALATRFPGGIFRAWSWLEPDWWCLVYPRPEKGPVPGPEELTGPDSGGRYGEGDADFQGLRRYRPGDSPRHVAWRLVARGQELHTKQFGGRAPSRLWLDWEALEGLALEARISRLARWVLDAERAGRAYGLRLPGELIPPGQGAGHRHRCLKALALLEAG